MPGYQNLHTHTTYCDGTLPPEAMIEAAIAKGCDSLGFSGHSYVAFDPDYSTPPEKAVEYAREINALKSKYEGTVEVFLGIEHDYFTETPLEGMDFIIGAAHYIRTGDEFNAVDSGAKKLRKITEDHFGGDIYAVTAAYFETLAGIMGKVDADIIAHFDLVAKHNLGGSLFDEMHPRYVSAALDAMEELLKKCRIFEVNTGMMYRIGKPEPHPSAFLLKELNKRGGEVILSSDSHKAESLCCNFGEMPELLKACGFKYMKRLTKTGFINVDLT